MTNYCFLISPNLCLIRAICTRDGRQLLVVVSASFGGLLLQPLHKDAATGFSSENVPTIAVSGTTNNPCGLRIKHQPTIHPALNSLFDLCGLREEEKK